MLQTHHTLSGAMRLSDMLNQPIHDVIAYLKGKPDYMGEAIAKMAYQALAKQRGQ